ncbi:MAG: flagellar basal body rod protein FlgB [Candidatus Eremiobacteraeota bacterium]|nr:flagellar basal body rod protein FlgB [Candidatus Eremiobacteraeota bacterium]
MSDISAMNFGSTVGMLSDAMTGAGTEQGALANNIANANTPNFRRSDVSFKEALAATQATPPDSNQLTLATDDDRQFAINGAQPGQPFDVKPTVDQTTQMRVDKSNVDVDQEMAQLSINSGYSQTMSQLLQVQFMRMREAISGNL